MKDIRAYINGFAADAVENGLAYPSSGDCWGCLMRTEANTTQGRSDGGFTIHPTTAPGRGDVTGASHYLDHLREKYYVPSLLYRAIEAQVFRNPQLNYELCVMDAANGRTDSLRRHLRSYFKRIMTALVEERLKSAERADDREDGAEERESEPHGPRCAQRFHGAAECDCGVADRNLGIVAGGAR